MRRFVTAVVLTVLTVTTLGAQTAESWLIRDVRLFDGLRTTEHRSVLLREGRIAEIGGPGLAAAGAEVVDGRGRTLLPGLIDSHVHVSEDVEGTLTQELSFGVTTVLDMFSSGARFEKMKRVHADDPPGLADVLSAGIGATAPGGHPTEMGGGALPTLSGPEDADAFVAARVADGSGYIKIIRDDLHQLLPKPVPTLDSATIAAVVRAAHARGKLTVVHVGTEPDARIAIAAGADGLAHLVTGDHLSGGFGAFAASHHIFVITTMETMYAVCARPDGSSLLADSNIVARLTPPWQKMLAMKWPYKPTSCNATDEEVRQLDAAHVPMLAGTDTPVPGSAYGASLHGELHLLVQDGLTPEAALTAATSAPAKAFHLDDRGVIAVGKRADLLLVDGDPTREILATRRIIAVWKRGVRGSFSGVRERD